MGNTNAIRGVIAAILTPRVRAGVIDQELLERNLKKVLDAGASGVCLSGATGEYVRTSPGEKREVVRVARRLVPKHKILAVAAGAGDAAESVLLARQAADEGADVILLPVPFFYHYSQEDVEHFYRDTAAQIPRPVLIYNLPAFTGRVETATAVRLIGAAPNIIGIKDSSDGLETLEALSAGDREPWVRLAGNDGVLAEALRRKVADGTISGVAGVLPELTVSLVDSARVGNLPAFDCAARLLDQLLTVLDTLPTPWGLKLIATARGFGREDFALHPSPGRKQQASVFLNWFHGWWPAADTELRPRLTLEAP
jgi:4-hydroxy-tetrahydrodipicolinate synthase